jgi:hypothetical protein
MMANQNPERGSATSFYSGYEDADEDTLFTFLRTIVSSRILIGGR